MEISTRIGTNRTGLDASAGRGRRMTDYAADPTAPGGIESMNSIRLASYRDSELLGSAPPPTSLKGVLKSGVTALQGKRAHVFIDKLGERLAFERSGIRFYEAVILKHAARAGQVGSVDAAALQRIKNDELSHFMLLRECLQQLGADPTAQTPWADVAALESAGLLSVITDPRTTLAQSLHAVLIGELADNACWENLIGLAEREGQPAMADRFREALRRETEHLGMVRNWVDELTLGELQLGASLR